MAQFTTCLHLRCGSFSRCIISPFPGLHTTPKTGLRSWDKALACLRRGQGPRPPWLERCDPPWSSEGQRNLGPFSPTPVPSCAIGVCPVLARWAAGWLRDSGSIPGGGRSRQGGVSDDRQWGPFSECSQSAGPCAEHFPRICFIHSSEPLSLGPLRLRGVKQPAQGHPAGARLELRLELRAVGFHF